MAVFVDFEEEDVEPPQDGQPPAWRESVAKADSASPARGLDNEGDEAQRPKVSEDVNMTSVTKALGCYPIIISIAAHIDLNTLDSLSRTCRRIHASMLEYRKPLLMSTLHCSNEHLPVDPEETLRYRARAGNWFYMEDSPGRSGATGKSGQCARDLVGECRRCSTVVCRNCAIKPPAPNVLADRHRRLCVACAEAPLGKLVTPRLPRDWTLDADDMKRAICQCASQGVWLCQPCGRTIRNDDIEYKRIWRWRNQYTASLGGLGTGIGEGDRGAICARDSACCAGRECEQETDGDAADARDADNFLSGSAPLSHTSSNSSLSPWGSGSGSPSSSIGSNTGLPGDPSERRTPSPQLKPGYERHEIEGIGGVMKKKLLRMVKVGACVPEWEDERVSGKILGRERDGLRRSWCGWCRRVIPSQKDWDAAERERIAVEAASKSV
ncbi:hypothetical protein QBC34DRAFT_395002 [Podospora aff. communis PSN243]|uniref:F-box domain-containing protein n=1 Tax=Podospora aff. communis PSN243 TaxID=3040156 RepID=A0AAV9H097_9PEZI|nr:hypothetical protein QBC34DRAFT_395002 [Podospora aff. communis PSN243]